MACKGSSRRGPAKPTHEPNEPHYQEGVIPRSPLGSLRWEVSAGKSPQGILALADHSRYNDFSGMGVKDGAAVNCLSPVNYWAVRAGNATLDLVAGPQYEEAHIMQAKLVVVGGDVGSAEIPLKLPVTIGRSREVTLTLPHPLVSRQHCEIFESEGRLRVRDLGSRNGTYVANVRVDGEEWLSSGDLLTIGNVTFRAVYCEPGARAQAPGTVRMTETVRADGTEQNPSGVARDASRILRGRNVYDSAIPLGEEDLFREDDLSDEGLGVDSGHFGEFDTESEKPKKQ